jgi:hypothetical protein
MTDSLTDDEPCHTGPAAHTCGHCADYPPPAVTPDARAHTRLADLDPVPPATLDLIQPPGGVCA